MFWRADGLDGDEGNRAKCESHRSLAILPDLAHSRTERRLRAIGRTEKGRGVLIVFTLRRKGGEVLIRPISARYMHKKEIETYEKENPDLTRPTARQRPSSTRPT